jgi:transcriptional regulator with XRE-family HTH domain
MSGRAAASVEQAPVIAKIREALRQRNLSTSDIAAKLGISATYLQTCLSGHAPLAPSRLVVACRELGVDLAVLCKVLDRLVGDTTLLRASRAVQRYDCSYCNAAIRQGQTYVRLESSGLSRRRGVPVEYFAVSARYKPDGFGKVRIRRPYTRVKGGRISTKWFCRSLNT